MAQFRTAPNAESYENSEDYLSATTNYIKADKILSSSHTKNALKTIIKISAMNNKLDIIKTTVDYGINLDSLIFINGNTVLHLATQFGNTDEELISYLASNMPNSKNKKNHDEEDAYDLASKTEIKNFLKSNGIGKIEIRDEFDPNSSSFSKYEWFFDNDTVTLSKNKFIMISDSIGQFKQAKEFPIDVKYDFSIETEVALLFDKNEMYSQGGVIMKSVPYGNLFKVSFLGEELRVSKYINSADTWSYINSKQMNDFEQDKYYKIKIEKEEDFFKLYVNDQLMIKVNISSNEIDIDNYFGFYTQNNARLEAKYLLVKGFKE